MTALTIYEKHPTADAYRVGGFYSPYALVAADKRFSEAELAAEWHRTASVEFAAIGDPSGYKPGTQQRAAIQRETLHRFATLRRGVRPARVGKVARNPGQETPANA